MQVRLHSNKHEVIRRGYVWFDTRRTVIQLSEQQSARARRGQHFIKGWLIAKGWRRSCIVAMPLEALHRLLADHDRVQSLLSSTAWPSSSGNDIRIWNETQLLVPKSELYSQKTARQTSNENWPGRYASVQEPLGAQEKRGLLPYMVSRGTPFITACFWSSR